MITLSKVDLIERVTASERLEKSKIAEHLDIWKKNVLDIGKYQCKSLKSLHETLGEIGRLEDHCDWSIVR